MPDATLADAAGADRAVTDAAPPAPTLPVTTVRVRFHELDPYGHVNHGVYLNYFETARIEALDGLGLGIEVLRERGLHLVVVEATIRFRSPGRARDVLAIETAITELRRASSWWRQRMTNAAGELVAELDVRTATTDDTGRPVPAPDDVVAIVAPYVTG